MRIVSKEKGRFSLQHPEAQVRITKGTTDSEFAARREKFGASPEL
jgi:hypothetical protein